MEDRANKAVSLPKVATRIPGLDDILHGGVPRGRVTLVGGGPGTGKTLLALEFLYRGALAGRPGIFMSFEEPPEHLRQNGRSLGWDLADLEASRMLFLMDGRPDPDMIVAGGFSLKGLLAIVEGQARSMGAERVAIDALDVLLRHFEDPQREVQQLRALQNWLTGLGLTAVLTTKDLEAGGASPYDDLHFMADCVIHLDQRIQDQVATKRMQVVKYRGSGYGSNQHPFLVGSTGMFFSAVSDMWLSYPALSERVSSGIPVLDEILGGGYLQGSCILVSGETGTGKTALASTFARSTCRTPGSVLYISFEEAEDGIVAGMASLGIDLATHIRDGRLRVLAVMPESRGIEEHLFEIFQAISDHRPQLVVVDAISACKRIAGERPAFDLVMRLVHFCRQRTITTQLINQSRGGPLEHEISGIGISSIIDTILVLYYQVVDQETRRLLHVMKSRGTRHSNRHHPYRLTDEGVRIEPPDVD